MWRELVERIAPGTRFSPGATEAALQDAERRLGHPLPSDLRAQLAESDGMEDSPGWTVLAWSVQRIVEENLTHRDPTWVFADDGPWEHRLCFADDGAGNDFFIDVSVVDGAVHEWDYIDGDSGRRADSLRAFWIDWLTPARPPRT